MVALGYTLSSEEHGPTTLVENAARAEEVGFEFVSISDHFHPWVEAQGESPFVWSTLGGIAQATDEIDVGVGVTCPTVRIHPAILAQAAATTARMLDGRFFFGVGSGENLNEHVLGDRWPEAAVRLEMLEEAVGVIRDLWEGENYSHHGTYYDVENAKIYTLPDELPPIVVSAFGPKAARSAADIGDGLWCVGPQEEPLETYAEAGGDGPKYAQIDVCYAESEEEALDTVYETWPNGEISGELSQVLPTPAHFEQAAEMVDREDVAESATPLGPDPEPFVDSVEACVDAGYDHVYFHQIGPDQEGFFEFYEEHLRSAF
ncbi:TIGR03557 family F420-dependent LLM class oxidoreductase [Halalkalicoccus sp. NIPERK01]|uniref:TIGR03557 family F420-dependent LLM class oxidoreductase n=1 Tax=Halalkalicoccus sp. NIPERK01 TaxID=3053469 RepID=UPI00256F0E3D|nr:TIGR03557 family F420-dependent LLM class oxidoreductase [Halalkalicoccus sp. NIPERK01]MDL5361033.1 TIGR03557 family F420-dependent LLM class oxidoreductase [Halalkalicoccus sp. NIPERK01]